MYYRLKNSFALRGWDKMSGALVKRASYFVQALEGQEFNVLLLCDGETDFTSCPLSGEELALLQHYVEKGTVEVLSEPAPLDEWQRYRFFPNRFVKAAFWSMTGRCNYNCRHCFMNAPEGQMGEISHEEAVSLIDQMADCGIMHVDLSGGEPFVRRDFWQLIDRMRSHNITVGTIYTNGFLLTDETLDAFEKRGMKPEFSISFDGLKWHDWMRGVPGAEETALEALRRCKRRGFPMDVEMCLHRGNLSTMRETIRELSAIGVSALKCSRVSDTELWQKNCEGNQLSYSEYLEAMLNYIPQYYEDDLSIMVLMCDVAILRTDDVDLFEIIAEKFSGKEDALNCHLCQAMRSACYIAPDGRMLPCMPFTACEAQLQFDRFQEIGLRSGLSNSFYMQFVDKRIQDFMKENEMCRQCEHVLTCGGGCRASALEGTGELMGADLNQCFLWKNGYVKQIRETVERAVADYKKRREAAEGAH